MSCYNQFDNYGFISSKFTDFDLFPVKQEIEKMQTNFSVATPFNHRLAGNIKKEYELCNCRNHVQNLLIPYVQSYIETNNFVQKYNLSEKDYNIELSSLWVNFQQKYEFNPFHTHTGILSFVIWIDIPYTFEDEINAAPGEGLAKESAGSFVFYYTDSLGQITEKRLNSDILENNTVLLFPAKMPHAVYPFYSSNNYRITVSGNFITSI